MSQPSSSQPPPTSPSHRLLTIPNVLSVSRLLLSPVLIVLAWADLPWWCLGLAVFLFFLDWLDGKLAILLKQKTILGAQLDSYGDVMLYACLLVAMVILRGEVLRQEVIWIAVAIASYCVSVVAGLVKFRRVPSYHNRLAKTSWLLMLIAVISLFADWSVWPLRIAMVGVMLTNLEATAITCVLSQWRANVPSIYHAIQMERAARGTASERET